MISKRDAALAILMTAIVWFTGYTNQVNTQQNQQALHQRDAEIQKIEQTTKTQQKEIASQSTRMQDAEQTIQAEHQTILDLQKKAQHLASRSGGISIPGFNPGPWEPYVATWYDNQGGINGSGITATGHRVREGIVAVDPRIIPLGSEIQVEYADGTESPPLLADDTGGAIQGNRIDIFTSSPAKAIQNGRQAVQVRILTRGR